jgi:hypothetical protein
MQMRCGWRTGCASVAKAMEGRERPDSGRRIELAPIQGHSTGDPVRAQLVGLRTAGAGFRTFPHLSTVDCTVCNALSSPGLARVSASPIPSKRSILSAGTRRSSKSSARPDGRSEVNDVHLGLLPKELAGVQEVLFRARATSIPDAATPADRSVRSWCCAHRHRFSAVHPALSGR